jgi:serine/threonine protein kinase/ABC-type branched-subunit amino acid transport system substrate-binding protein
MECPHCGAINRPGVRFCSQCGRSLAPQSPAAAGSSGANSLAPGARLQGGRYDIQRVLGQGGMGAALLAVDNRLDGKRVVIKELLSDQTDPDRRQDDVRNFKREVALLAHLDHPLIPSVTDHFQEGERYFMVEEYVEGENLEELLARNGGPLRERDVLMYASQLLDVLHYLEQQTPPVVHRDIKPANIIIGSKDRRAHLVDFGIARADVMRNAVRRQTSALGTPGYAPPEQYQGNADPRSDLYALAATMHHLLTDRDPRQYPPFTYPPARNLNPQLSPEIERVLMRALDNDPLRRYQSAAAMKQEIDAILLQRFGVAGSDPASYILNASAPTSVVLPGSGTPTAGAGTPSGPHTLPPLTPATPAAPPPPAYQPAGQASMTPPVLYPLAQPVTPPPVSSPAFPPPLYGYGRSPRRRRPWLVLVVPLLIVVLFGLYLLVYGQRFGHQVGLNTAAGTTPVSTATITPPPSLKNGIGAYTVNDPSSGHKDYIGISDGSVAFDTARADGTLKQQAAQHFKAGDISGAEALWQEALTLDSNDAEVLIYQEDQRVLASGNPYITLVVATMLTGSDAGAIGTGRDDLQGAYMAQKEYNSGFKLGSGVQVRLLIANSGGNSLFATAVAQQIVQAAQADRTIVGVMGWPYSSRALNAIGILSAAHIPMVSQTASSDLLSGRSPFFFRVCPSDHQQGMVGADYAFHQLQARTVALFFDPADAYSQSLANAFSTRYSADGGTIVVREQYTVGKPTTIPQLLQDALAHNPDMLYFAGYASDVSALLTNLPTSGPFAKLQVMGGDALYELQGYPSSARAGFLRLHFTAFAYPDEWGYLKLPLPAFFTVYPQTFNPGGQHVGYGYTRPDNDVILSYDASLVLLEASRMIISSGKTSFSGVDLQQALTHVNGSQAVQVISGVIAFGSDGNPLNKAVVVLLVDSGGHIKLESIQGRFQK